MNQREKSVEKLQELANSKDTEKAHYEADNIIVEFVPQEVREAYEKVPKWYS